MTIFGDLFLRRAPIEKLLAWCKDYIGEDSAAKYTLIDALGNVDNPSARSMLIDLVRVDEEAAICALYFNLEFHSDNFNNEELPPDPEVVEVLLRERDPEDGDWAISLGRTLVQKHPGWRGVFGALPGNDNRTQLLLDLILKDESCFPQLAATAISKISAFDHSTRAILGKLDFWAKTSPNLVAEALSTRDPYLVGSLLQELQGQEIPLLSIRPLEWWLDWEEECLKSKERAVVWCGWRINQFLVQGNSETIAAVLKVFNDKPIKGFNRIGQLVLNEGASKITTDQLSSTALARLLNKGERFAFSAAVLGQAATEDFVRTVLLPHLVSNPAHVWIRKAIEIAGSRHNRRYLVGAN